MPYNCQFQPIIEVEAPAGKTILFNSTNPLVLYLIKTESVTTVAGLQNHEARNWISGEGAIYTIPAGVTVKAVRYRETGYDTTFAGSFHCNDEDYNILWKKGARTAYLCMRDHFYDCPDRERVGFWGDGTPELGQCFYVFDPKSHRLCKDLVLRKLQPKFYPGQHLEFLGSYGLWFYYMQTGDLDSMRAVYEPTKTFLFKTYKFGNKNTWFDWGDPTQGHRRHRDLLLLRLPANPPENRPRHRASRPTFPSSTKDLKPSAPPFTRLIGKTDITCPARWTARTTAPTRWPSTAGSPRPPRGMPSIRTSSPKKTHSSNFFDRWVFEALCKMGRQEQALLRMAARYRTMIPCRFTTLWEHYDRIWATRNSFDLASSLNHGWNPPVLNLSQTIAGISPVEPGWTTYQVLPMEAFLNGNPRRRAHHQRQGHRRDEKRLRQLCDRCFLPARSHGHRRHSQRLLHAHRLGGGRWRNRLERRLPARHRQGHRLGRRRRWLFEVQRPSRQPQIHRPRLPAHRFAQDTRETRRP